MNEDEHLIFKYTEKDKEIRIFRPHEIKSLFDAVPKLDHKIKCEVCLYTGARFEEIRWLYKHPESFKKDTILMPSTKTEARHSERYIKLNSLGQTAVRYYLQSKKNIPTRQTWDENLLRWAKQANLDTRGICMKSFRKTWEAWLITKYGKEHKLNIFLSQGHTEETALEYYIMLPFSDQDKKDIQFYTEGWI